VLRRSVRKLRRLPSNRAGARRRRPNASATTSRRSPRTTGFLEPLRTLASGIALEGLRSARREVSEDDEAQIFNALYIAGTQTQADQTYAAYLKAAAILEKQFVKYPDHPGVAHYLIHSYDAPPIAAKV
jgi:hypothetical protein